MATYHQKPHPVEAMQWTGRNWRDIKTWLTHLKSSGPARLDPPNGVGTLKLRTVDFAVDIEVTDWIIMNRNGVVYMATDEAFRDGFAFHSDTLNRDGGAAERPLAN